MSETIVVAAIAASSGLLGTVIGSWSAAVTANAARKNDYKKFIFKQRMEAYQAFSNAYSEFGKDPSNKEAYSNVMQALQHIYLIASRKTCHYATEFCLLLSDVSPEKSISQEFCDARDNLLQSFRSDLLDYKGS